jgi:hypothetical protein
MTFRLGEIAIRMIMTKLSSIVSLAQEWFWFHAGQGYKLVSYFRMEWPPQKMDVSI